MSDREKREAFVTLATNDTYSLGCLVLGCSLRRVNTSRQLVVMVTTDVSNPMRSQLAQVYDHIQEVDLLDSKDPKNLTLLGRPDLNVTFTKLHCWRLTQYDKAVFLDADTLVLQNVDELFDREELSAAPDAGWPDCFNSGVFVFKPSEETYESLLNFAVNRGSFDGGDQGLLNLYFSNWSTDDISKHLPFIYNVVSQAFYSYLPAFTQFKDRVRIVHFIGATKPWHQPYNTSTRSVQPLPGSGHSQEFLQAWWNIFMEMVQPSLDPSLRRKRHLRPTIVITEPPSLSQTYAYIPNTKNSAIVKHQTFKTAPWTWTNNFLGNSVYCCQSLFKAFTSCWNRKPNSCRSETADVKQRAQLERAYPPPTKTQPIEKPEPSQEPTHHRPNERESMDETISTVYPYVPPKLDEVFYEVDKQTKDTSEKESIKEESKIIEVPVHRRAYTALEANYPEEPISNINPEQPPYSIYETTRVLEGWERGRRDHDSGYTSRNGSYGETEIKETTEAIKETFEKANTDKEGLTSSAVSHKEEAGHEGKKAENSISSESGLVGELAHLSVEGYHSPTILLSDRERKLNWEKGQIDYLGQDSFDNIQKKLDETLNKQEAPAQPPLSSPFTPKEVVLAPVKTVAVQEPKTVAVSEPKAQAVPEPKTVAAPAPKVTAPPVQKPAVAPTPTATVAPTPKPTMAAAPTQAPVKTAAPTPKVTASAPKVVAAAPKVEAATAKTTATAPAPKVTAPAPKVIAPAPKAAAPAPKVAAPAPKVAAPAPKVEAPAPAPVAPKATAAAPKTTAPAPKLIASAPKTTAAAAAPPKAAAAADPKSSATAKPTGAGDAKSTAAPASKVSIGAKLFGAKK